MASEAYQRCRQSVGETNHALRAFEPFSNECDLVDYFFFATFEPKSYLVGSNEISFTT